MLYRPSPSVTTVRTLSIKAGLAASTVTPGSTAADASLTTPAIPLACCADVASGMSTNAPTSAATHRRATHLEIIRPPFSRTFPLDGAHADHFSTADTFWIFIEQSETSECTPSSGKVLEKGG